MDGFQASVPPKRIRQLPFSLGGMRLMSAVRSRVAAHWSSWADRRLHPNDQTTATAGRGNVGRGH